MPPINVQQTTSIFRRCRQGAGRRKKAFPSRLMSEYCGLMIDGEPIRPFVDLRPGNAERQSKCKKCDGIRMMPPQKTGETDTSFSGYRSSNNFIATKYRTVVSACCPREQTED